MNKAKKNNIYIQLFLTFLKIGAFTFGGGYAMIPLITSEAVSKKKWIKESDILDIVAIAESTPGPIAINSATFVGYRVGGVIGAVCSTIGVVLPSFLIIFAISFVLSQFENLKIVQYAFNGIRAGVLALIMSALISMYKQCPKNVMSYIIMAAALVLTVVFGVNVLLVIVMCAVTGIAQAIIVNRKEDNNDLS